MLGYTHFQRFEQCDCEVSCHSWHPWLVHKPSRFDPPYCRSCHIFGLAWRRSLCEFQTHKNINHFIACSQPLVSFQYSALRWVVHGSFRCQKQNLEPTTMTMNNVKFNNFTIHIYITRRRFDACGRTEFCIYWAVPMDEATDPSWNLTVLRYTYTVLFHRTGDRWIKYLSLSYSLRWCLAKTNLLPTAPAVDTIGDHQDPAAPLKTVLKENSNPFSS